MTFKRNAALTLSALMTAALATLPLAGPAGAASADNAPVCGGTVADYEDLGLLSSFSGPAWSSGPNGRQDYGTISVSLLLGEATVTSSTNSALDITGPAKMGALYANQPTIWITGTNVNGALTTWILQLPVCANGGNSVTRATAEFVVPGFSITGSLSRLL